MPGLSETIALFRDMEQRTIWDPLMEETRIIKDLNNCTSLSYLRTKAQWPTSSRDQVVLSHGIKTNDNAALIVSSSFDLPEIGPVKGCIRSDIKVVTYVLNLDSDGNTVVRASSYIDPKGYIPSTLLSFVNKIAVPEGYKKFSQLAKATAPRLRKSGLNVKVDSKKSQVWSINLSLASKLMLKLSNFQQNVGHSQCRWRICEEV